MSINREIEGSIFIESTLNYTFNTARELYDFENATFVDPSNTLLSNYESICNKLKNIITDTIEKINRKSSEPQINLSDIVIGVVEVDEGVDDEIIATVNSFIEIKGDCDPFILFELDEVMETSVADGLEMVIDQYSKIGGIVMIGEKEVDLLKDFNFPLN